MRRWSFLARTVDTFIGPAVFKAHSRLLPAVLIPIRIQTRTSIPRMRIALWRTTSTTTTTTLSTILTSLVRSLAYISSTSNSVTLLFYRPTSRHRCNTHKYGKRYPPVRLLLLRLLILPTDMLSDLAHLSHSTLSNLSSSFRAPGET